MAGRPFGKQEVVSDEPNSLLDELHSNVFCGEEVLTLFRHNAFRQECAQNGDRDPDVGDRVQNLEAAVPIL